MAGPLPEDESPARADQIAGVVVRPAEARDLSAITAIYADSVVRGLGSFEEIPPDLAEMSQRYQALTALGLPYLVAEIDGRIAGFTYAGPFRPRSAYRHTVEDSIYVLSDVRGRGVGSQLLGGLIDACTAIGKRQMIAVVGDSGNTASVMLHRRMGFRLSGLLYAVGFKAGHWVDCVMMQRSLGAGEDSAPGPD
ncbi:MAG: N-acetyltransferase family protein [Alphaproteobacteria bacterium]